MRLIVASVNVIRLPVAGRPQNSPTCVIEKRTYAAAMSPSASVCSTFASISAKAGVHALGDHALEGLAVLRRARRVAVLEVLGEDLVGHAARGLGVVARDAVLEPAADELLVAFRIGHLTFLSTLGVAAILRSAAAVPRHQEVRWI